MKVDLDQLKRQYEAMPDDEFQAIRRRDLTETARECYDQELTRRDPNRYQIVREQDIQQAERDARLAAADAKDPEPKPRFYMGVALALAGVTTIIVLTVAVIRLQHDLPLETQPLLVLGGVWFSAFMSYVPYLRAKIEWRDRRREEGLL